MYASNNLSPQSFIVRERAYCHLLQPGTVMLAGVQKRSRIEYAPLVKKGATDSEREQGVFARKRTWRTEEYKTEYKLKQQIRKMVEEALRGNWDLADGISEKSTSRYRSSPRESGHLSRRASG